MPPFVLPAAWVPLLRLLYLLLAFFVTLGGVRLRRPQPSELRAAIVAAGVQLILSVGLDAAGQALGLWQYAVDDALVLGVPLDLHIAWALPWGLLFVLWAPRARKAARRYALVFWVATVTYDALLAPAATALVRRGAGLCCLLGDAAMIEALLAAALVLYRAVLRSGQVLARGTPEPGELRQLRRGAAVRAGLYLLVFGALSFGLLPYLILTLTGRAVWPLPPLPLALRALLGAAIGLCLLVPLWAVREFVRAGGTPLPFDPPLALVVGGPYARVRNPMQVGAIAALLGVAALYRSWALLVYAVDLVVLSQLLFLRQEQAELGARFGPAYHRYCAAVRCWVPRLTPYRYPRQLSGTGEPGSLGREPGVGTLGVAPLVSTESARRVASVSISDVQTRGE